MTPSMVLEMLQEWMQGRGAGKDRQVCSWANEVRWYGEYADGRSSPKGIVAANWNNLDRYDQVMRSRITTSNIPKRMCKVFERMGVEIEWNDMVSECCDCMKCIQTQPDGYCWTPQYIENEDGYLCAECAKDEAEELLELEYEGQCKAWTLDNINPLEYGYVKLDNKQYETGLHQGQNDNPKEVAKALHAHGITRFIFVLDDQGQFDCKWSVLVKEDEED